MFSPDNFYQTQTDEKVKKPANNLSPSGQFRNDISNVFSKLYPFELKLDNSSNIFNCS